MRTSYDPEVDALFVHLVDAPTHESQEVAPDVIFDYDENGRLVRIEVLNASRTVALGALRASSAQRE